jgi:histidyl-tRNA synthetase
MKKADGSGAAFAVIIGEDEVRNEVVAVKTLREGQGNGDAAQQQASVPFDEAVDYIVDQVIGGHDHDHDHDHVHYHP